MNRPDSANDCPGHQRPFRVNESLSITEAEILLGVELLPSGRRRTALEAAVAEMFGDDLDKRILPFDSDAALEFAKIVALRRGLGRPISHADAQIAAIARSRGAAVATRNTEDLEHCGIRVLNPWLGE